jgi:hypothetical protein
MAMGALSVYAAPAEESTGITPEEGAILLKARSLVDCQAPIPPPGSGGPGGPAPGPFIPNYVLRWNNNGAMRFVYRAPITQTMIEDEGSLQQFAQDFNNGWQNTLRNAGDQGRAAQRVFRRLQFTIRIPQNAGIQPLEWVTVGVWPGRTPPTPQDMSSAMSTLEQLFQCRATFDPSLDFANDLRKVKGRATPGTCSGNPIDIHRLFNVCTYPPSVFSGSKLITINRALPKTPH